MKKASGEIRGLFLLFGVDIPPDQSLAKGFHMKPERLKIIAYWIFTVWLCFGMLSSGIFQLIRMKGTHEFIINNLGYPDYFLTILGVWKILGVMAILAPGLALLKEWAYAGFFFVAMGVIWSHVASGSPFGEVFPGILLMALTVISWWLRPASRKLAAT
jgi:uncharacterized membrane protein YphA (DoxX/SURF4 family)